VIPKTDEYRAKAAECAKRAQEASNSTMKEVCRDMARMWLHLAQQADMDAGRPRSEKSSSDNQS
jgi:hypothetical protein